MTHFVYMITQKWFVKTESDICSERKSWNNSYFSAESTFQESGVNKTFTHVQEQKKAMSTRHCAHIPSSVKSPLRISHSEPRNIKLNLWAKPKKHFIVWKTAMKVEFIFDFNSPDAWITLFPSQPSVDVMLTRHFRSGSCIFKKSSGTMIFFSPIVFQKTS